MTIPSELVGSLPRTTELVSMWDGSKGAAVAVQAVRDTVQMLEKLGSQVVSDGEQTKADAWTYPVTGAGNVAVGDGVVIPYADGHQRQLPRLTAGPFRIRNHAADYLRAAQKHATVPVKQAVVAPSTLSLLYPPDGLSGYPREDFVDDVLNETEADIRACLAAGAHVVQIDFPEARLSVKLDPSGGLLRDFVDLNNRLLSRFDDADRARIGIHCNPGADQDATHSLDVDYAEVLPSLFRLEAGNFYLQMASESDPDRVLRIVAEQMRSEGRIFVGVVDPIDPRVESPEEVRDRVLNAARHIPLDRLGTCDDAGFAPYADDRSKSRDTAFAKIRARIEGTALAAAALGA
ncbi:5-methyltetrahydropteroyltriglutamate--homocysteine methyltransferase [Uniformispora flossi]|uniref:5-methyltetrahydropteroyltriglutamate-- homocysteine methyltransferase n=1 Tax=Uniformispora flossi TaxID=3390723 RepID=UPI003C2BD2E4